MTTAIKWLAGIAAVFFAVFVFVVLGLFTFKSFAEGCLVALPFEAFNRLRVWHDIEPIRPRELPHDHRWIPPHWEPNHHEEPHHDPRPPHPGPRPRPRAEEESDVGQPWHWSREAVAGDYFKVPNRYGRLTQPDTEKTE